MSFIWKEIVPNDPYCLYTENPVNPAELIYITQLYQPLIGPLSASLYITFFHECSMEIKETTMGNHRGLMSMMGVSLRDTLAARENLEAVGLLRTLKVEGEQGNLYYEYILRSPLSASYFFSDDMLSIILLNKVGKTKYRYLRERLLGNQQDQSDTSIKTDLTKSFDQVFRSINPSELNVIPGSETDDFLLEVDEQYPAKPMASSSSKEEQLIKLTEVELDFAFLEAALPKTGIKSRKLSDDLKNVITELAFWFQLDDFQLSHFLQEPYIYSEANEIQSERLRKIVKDWYYHEHQGVPVIAKPSPSTQTNEPQNEETLTQADAHKQAIATMSPITLIEKYQTGGRVSPADLKILEELAHTYLLPLGVINVLLEYVMLTNDKQLPGPLIYKIATHWKRLNIETVEQALDQAKRFDQELKKKSNTPTQKTRQRSPAQARQGSKKDVLPEWVVKQGDKTWLDEGLNEEQKREAQDLLRALGELNE